MTNDSDDDMLQLMMQMLKLASMISGPMQDEVGAPHSLGTNELRILMCLGGEGPMAGHDITELMAITPMNVSRAIAGLGARGLVEPVIDPANRRRRPVQLSAQGWQTRGSLTPDLRRIAEQLLQPLSKNERAGMSKGVGKVIARLEAWHESHHPHS